jgi:hypothetical protein
MKDLTKTMEISMREMEDEDANAVPGKTEPEIHSEASASTKISEPHSPSTSSSHPIPAPSVEPHPDIPSATAVKTPPVSGTSTPHNGRAIPIRPALMDRSEEDARLEAAGVTDAEKELRAKEKKKGGLTREQREELAAYELERKKIREERINALSEKLIARISIWTETDKGDDVTKAFKDKTKLEIENLKMESFGLEILHAIGATYIMKATGFLKSQKFFGITGFFSRIKDKGTLVKDTWNTMSAAIDAQLTMEEMAKLEEKGGEDWTDEKKAEYEKRVTGKILAAAWRGSKFEIQSVLRDVCDRVLHDKKIKLEKRIERAEALVIIGDMFQKAERDPEEEGDFMAFEQLMAEAAAKKEHKGDKKGKKEKEKEKETPVTK